MKVEVNKEVCIGCGLCASIYPEIFEMSKNGHSKVREDAKDMDKKKLKEIMSSCPSIAIFELLKEKEAEEKL